MKLHIEIDTEKQDDRDYLNRLFPPAPSIAPAPTPSTTPPIIKRDDGKIRVPPQGDRKATKAAIFDLLERREMMTMQEFVMEGFDQNRIYSQLSIFRKFGLIDSSTDRPKKYFIKSKGNPQLREMLKNAGKTEVMR